MGEAREVDRQARLELLYDLSCAFASKTDLAELIPLVIEKCRDVLDASGASVLMLDSDRDELYFPFVAETDADAAARLQDVRFPAGQGISGEVVRTLEAVRVDDAGSDPRFYDGVDRKTGVITGPLLAAPFAPQPGITGVLQAVRRRGEPSFDDGDLLFLIALARGVGVAIGNAEMFGRLRESQENLRAELGALRRDAARRDGFHEIIGGASVMKDVFDLMESAAASPIVVLIEGETGTGKELVARGIHRASPRSRGPFVAVNCAALPESLLESELFGHRRGAFTGAVQDQKGIFEAAAGGTIFLDEIGEMPLSMQAKLLRVLQEGEISRVGETQPRRVDVRVISATNRSLEGLVDGGQMRPDLFYRLSAFPISLPALRDRRDDIPLFVAHFLKDAARRHDREVAGVDAEALDLLHRAEWPGNVRQLRNEVERAVALARAGDTIGPRHLSERHRTGTTRSMPETTNGSASADLDAEPDAVAEPDLRKARAAFEARHIRAVLRQHEGNVSHAARALGLSRAMLQKKMKDYELR
jgi:Nif-specific regulatory protein